MSYKVDKFNGTFLVNVEDGAVDTTTDLRFIGKNYAGYGEIHNENFLHLLENFSNTSPPPKAILGQIWFDSTAGVKKLKFWDGSAWKIASGSTPSTASPTGLSPGELWFDTTTEQLNVWTGSKFLLIGPENSPAINATAFVSEIVKDQTDASHSILRGNISEQTLIVISKDEFVIKPNTYGWAQGKFITIKQGITLINTPAQTGITTTDFTFWGTASSAKGIIGPDNSLLTYDDFVLNSDSNTFLDDGITIGQSNDLRIWIESGTVPIIENQNYSDPTSSIVFRIKTDGNGGHQDPLVITRDGIVPSSASTFSVGTASNKWASVYATNLYGNLTGNVIGNTTGIHTGNLNDNNGITRFDAATATFTGIFGTTSSPGTFTGTFNGSLNGTASVAETVGGYAFSLLAIPNTIPVRNNNADIVANRFIGIADTADKLLVGSEYQSASIAQVSNTVVARDGNADITARIFNGTATSANYADLAEKYLTDTDYPAGTVVMVGGTQEVTASISGSVAIGVVSTSPAFMMNSTLVGGTYVALKGRVPVFIIGNVTKGDRLVAADNGHAIVDNTSPIYFGISLETSTNTGSKLIESIIL